MTQDDPQDDPMVTQDDPKVTQDDPQVTKDDSKVTKDDPRVTQHGPLVTQNDPRATQDDLQLLLNSTPGSCTELHLRETNAKEVSMAIAHICRAPNLKYFIMSST